MRSVVTITTAPPGTGKTYWRCAVFLLREWLPEHEGVHWSNFPVRVDELAHEAERRYGGDAVTYADRVRVIPEVVMASWRAGESGPWDYFEGVDLVGCHIAIDEAHEYVGRTQKIAYVKKWEMWCSQVRHLGATLEFVTQHPDKLAKVIHNLAEIRISLTNSEVRRDPFLGIPLGEWYELRAGWLTGKYDPAIYCVERRKVDEKWVVSHAEWFRIEGEYFRFYDSYSAPHGGVQGGRSQKRQFQRVGKIGLTWWFVRRNMGRIVGRVLLVGVVVWVCFGGGGRWAVQKWMDAAKSIRVANGREAQAAVESVVERAPEYPVVPLRDLEQLAAAERIYIGPDEKGESVFADADDVRELYAAWKWGEERQGELERELKTVREELEQERERVAEVVGMSRESVGFADGRWYRIGERIEGGKYEGLQVAQVDWDRRVVWLSDGRKLGLRRVGGKTSFGGVAVERLGEVGGSIGESATKWAGVAK